MKIGISLSILAQAGRSDVAVYKEHLELGDLAEPLGFDSIFALEHHFTGYSMSPAPTQVAELFRRSHQARRSGHLRYRAAVARPDPRCGADRAAGRAVRRALPVRVRARRGECGVRRLSHPDGGSTRPLRRIRAARPSWRSASPEVRMAGRALPDPADLDPSAGRLQSGTAVLCVIRYARISRDHGEARLRHDGDHAERMAEGRGRYRSLPRVAESRSCARPPIILTNVSCAESRDEAHERAMKYLGRKWDSIDNHYHFSDGHLAAVKGYEAYGKMARPTPR